MCFQINPKAKRPRHKLVYKVVYLDENDRVRSPYKTQCIWKEGETKTIPRTAQTSRLSAVHSETRHAMAGFYVFFNFKKAERAVDSNKYAILALEVDPQDWICTSNDPIHFAPYRAAKTLDPKLTCATYRKVKVAREQPQLRWYGERK